MEEPGRALVDSNLGENDSPREGVGQVGEEALSEILAFRKNRERISF